MSHRAEPQQLARADFGKLTVVKPIPETVKAMLYEVFRCPKIEPRIDYSEA